MFRRGNVWGLLYRILSRNHKKELLRSLWVGRRDASGAGRLHECNQRFLGRGASVECC